MPDVTEIETLARTLGGGWRYDEAGNYLVVLTLPEARVLEEKTAQPQKCEYRIVNPTIYRNYTLADVMNEWAATGWRVVTVIPKDGPGYADQIVFERTINEREREENERH